MLFGIGPGFGMTQSLYALMRLWKSCSELQEEEKQTGQECCSQLQGLRHLHD